MKFIREEDETEEGLGHTEIIKTEREPQFSVKNERERAQTLTCIPCANDWKAMCPAQPTIWLYWISAKVLRVLTGTDTK